MTQGCALFLCAVEGESAGEPLAPKAGCQLPSMSAAHLSEARSELRFACFAQQIRLPLGVIPKVGFWVHRSSFQSRDVQEDRDLPLTRCAGRSRASIRHRSPPPFRKPFYSSDSQAFGSLTGAIALWRREARTTSK